MKKLILAFAMCLSSANTFAQNNMQNSNQHNQKSQQAKDKHEDGILMKDGKLMVIKNGEKTPMTQNEMVLTDGTIIQSDGTVVRKNGTRTSLKNGEHISMSGNVTKMGEGYKSEDDKKENRRNNDGNQMNQNRTNPNQIKTDSTK
jgi:hypothetical protein